jgi:DNA-directed RNA polymerase specialized sigma24 family protein
MAFVILTAALPVGAQNTPRIAATLGIARSTVVDDIHAALDKMRRRLERGA